MLCRRHHLRQAQVGVRATHDVGVMVLHEVVSHALSHASKHSEHRLRTLFLLVGEELVEPLVYLVLGVFPYRAGVEEYRVGFSLVVGRLIARHLHYRCHHLRVGDIHLATISFYI